jgi:hypothetical protein
MLTQGASRTQLALPAVPGDSNQALPDAALARVGVGLRAFQMHAALGVGPAPILHAQAAASGTPSRRAFEEFTKLFSTLQQLGAWSALTGTLPALAPQPLHHVEGRFPQMAFDPAKGKLSPGSVEEAAVGFLAEQAGIVPGPMVRESTGMAEFVDAHGGFWDVKSPVSPRAGQRWTFDAQHQVVKVLHDISQNNTVLLNLSRCTATDAQQVLTLLATQLTPAEQARVRVLRTSQVVVRE